MAARIALLHEDAASDYGMDCPDLPGCVTAGRTLEEARRAPAGALTLHLEGRPRMARQRRNLPRSMR